MSDDVDTDADPLEADGGDLQPGTNGADGGFDDATPGGDGEKPPEQTDDSFVDGLKDGASTVGAAVSSFIGSAGESAKQATPAGERIGAAIGKWVGVSIATATSAASTAVYTGTKFLPFIGEKFWKSAMETSLRRYQKAAGADVVNLCHREAGKIEPIATNWVEGEDIGDKPGWKAVGEDKVWDPAAEGRGVERLGKADVIITDEASWQTADPLKMRVSEALDLEKVDPLVTNATLQQTIVQDPDGMTSGGGAAVADGGYRAGPVELNAAEAVPDDYVIDLAPDNPNADGMRISARKYKEMDLTKTSAEEMKNQEIRGKLAGKAGNDNKGVVFKMALAALAFVLLWEFGPAILSAIFGESLTSMSGGGNIPLIAGGVL